MVVLTTPRMRLEPLGDAHFDGLFALNSDPAVMRFITGKPDTREDTQANIDRVKAAWERFGYSWWVFIEESTGELIGAGCVQHLGRDPDNPLELGWRLRADKWGQGYASEAARRMAAFAFEQTGTDVLTAVCHPDNRKSAQVMERLGMRFRGKETWYDMTTLAYEITRTEWLAR
jgi:RimJ/RimL family protein N-acetyltransferase